jgi:transposase
MSVCVLDQTGQVRLEQTAKTRPDVFLAMLQPFRGGLVVSAECVFCWYWLADLCADEGIEFVLGHALYMKAIHGGKAKNDRIDAEKIARLLRGGNLPMSYVYPREMRSTRDLLRRRTFLVRRRAEAMGHITNTHSQYNLPPSGTLSYKANRSGVADSFEDESVRWMVQTDLTLIGHYDAVIRELENYLERHAKVNDPHTYQLLRTVPGIGRVLALVILYEIDTIRRFPTVGQFVSYCRLVKCAHESAGKRLGSGGSKIGNAHLKWAFSEAVPLMMRELPEAKRFVQRRERKVGKGKAMSILGARIARAVYHMLKRKEPFHVKTFFAS